nr:MAG TPA: hypothetical protein [Caudoviricetes sp.]
MGFTEPKRQHSLNFRNFIVELAPLPTRVVFGGVAQ